MVALVADIVALLRALKREFFPTTHSPFGALRPGRYWHVTHAHPMNLMLLNTWTGKGKLSSMSETRRQHGEHLVSIGDLYPAIDADSEAVWEAVRAARFPGLPSRQGALFFFERKEDAALAKAWTRLETVTFEARIHASARVHRADLNWFEQPHDDLEAAALAYWQGEPNPTLPPVWELIVDGSVFVPGWAAPPFGPIVTGASAGKQWADVQLSCATCGRRAQVIAPEVVFYVSADRSKCVADEDELYACPQFMPAIRSVWRELEQQGFTRDGRAS